MASQDSQPYHWPYTDQNDMNFTIRGRTLIFMIVLFFIILLVTLLFVYARWVCRYDGHLPMGLNLAQLHSNGPSPQQQGLDPASIKKLPIILHREPSIPKSSLEETECCICLGVFKDGEKLKVLPVCGHFFHCQCVDRWLSGHSSCPLCRRSLQVVSSLPRILIQEGPIRIGVQY